MESSEYGAQTKLKSPGSGPCFLVWLPSAAWILDPLVFGHRRCVLSYLSSLGSSPSQVDVTGFISMSLYTSLLGSVFMFRPWSGLCLTFWSWFGSPYHWVAIFRMSSFFFFFFVFLPFLGHMEISAYGDFQARGRIRAVAPGLHHSHRNVGSELRP